MGQPSYEQGDFYTSESDSNEMEANDSTVYKNDSNKRSSEDDEAEKNDQAQSKEKRGDKAGTEKKKELKQTKMDDFSTHSKQKKYPLRSHYSYSDTERYRQGYPDLKDDKSVNDNLKFYMNEIPSSPDGDFIDEIHKKWKRDYDKLEKHHGYIQWLFPIREKGMNWEAQPLQLHEAKAIIADKKAKGRVLESYKLMLDFYGMMLDNEETGEICRSSNYEDRYDNLNWLSYNYLRITRILKCLGELGYEHLKKPFLDFIINELFDGQFPNCWRSCQDYWIGTIKDDKDREELSQKIRSGER